MGPPNCRCRNFRRRRGELDLVAEHRGVLIIAEIRLRADDRHGGAAASVDATKQRSLVFAARCFLRAWASPPACRFDVVAIEGGRIEWLQAAFDAPSLYVAGPEEALVVAVTQLVSNALKFSPQLPLFTKAGSCKIFAISVIGIGSLSLSHVPH